MGGLPGSPGGQGCGPQGLEPGSDPGSNRLEGFLGPLGPQPGQGLACQKGTLLALAVLHS